MPSQKKKLKAYRFQPVFKRQKGKRYRKTNISQYRGKAGVYLIKRRKGRIVYIGSSRNDVYRECMRHFYEYNDAKDPLQGLLLFNFFGQRRVYFDPEKNDYSVRIVLTPPKDAPKLEAALIDKHKPEMNLRTERTVIEEEEKEQFQKAYNEAEKTGIFDPEDEPPF